MNVLDLIERATPLLDVRAEREYQQGHVPGAVNLPILKDQERQKVGTCYKKHGQQAAEELGFKLVSGAVREARVEAWADFVRTHPEAYLICWRGGLRSQIAQQWLEAAGYRLERVPQGYKSLRRACLSTLEAAANDRAPWWIVAGKTGTAKTTLIQDCQHSIDLEYFAHHRGSAFGAYASPQPSPATFENALAAAWLQKPQGALVLEDESRTIGRVAVPESWHRRMQATPLLLIEADVETRVRHIKAEYVDEALQTTQPDDLHQRYHQALKKIGRRLGGLRLKQMTDLLDDAFAGRCEHEAWIRRLLVDYYDPMYEYQLKKKEQRVAFRGDWQAVRDYLKTRVCNQ